MPLLAFPSASSVYRVSVPLMLLASLPACTAIGSVMSPYPEKFSCKNSDHGQCIHPERAYEDAVAGAVSRSDPKVTNDRKMLSNGATAASTGTTCSPVLTNPPPRVIRRISSGKPVTQAPSVDTLNNFTSRFPVFADSRCFQAPAILPA